MTIPITRRAFFTASILMSATFLFGCKKSKETPGLYVDNGGTVYVTFDGRDFSASRVFDQFGGTTSDVITYQSANSTLGSSSTSVDTIEYAKVAAGGYVGVGGGLFIWSPNEMSSDDFVHYCNTHMHLFPARETFTTAGIEDLEALGFSLPAGFSL